MTTPTRPSAPSAARAPRPWGWLIGGVIFVGMMVICPPFHVTSRQHAAASVASAAAGAFDPVAFAATFWSGPLTTAVNSAPALAPLLTDLQRDPAAAAAKHGHRVGLGSGAYFFARGAGRVTAIERSRLLVDVGGVLVAVRTGPVFGNVVRDGCGLLEVNQVPGLAEFNALSAELNRLVEAQVQPSLKAGVTVGATVTFAGCAEAPEALPASGAPLLTFVPLQALVQP